MNYPIRIQDSVNGLHALDMLRDEQVVVSFVTLVSLVLVVVTNLIMTLVWAIHTPLTALKVPIPAPTRPLQATQIHFGYGNPS